MLNDIQAAIPVGVLLSFLVGPVFFVLLETSILKGFRAAMVFDIGVVTADIIFLIIAYFSSFQLLENLSNQPGLYVFGGTILLIYGFILFIKKAKETDLETKNIRIVPVTHSDFLGLFVKGFLINFINVGVLVFWLGLLIVVSPNLDNDPKRIRLFFGTVLAAYFTVDMLKVLLAKQLKSKLTEKRVRGLKKIIGFLLMICGLALIIKGFLPFNLQNEIEQISR